MSFFSGACFCFPFEATKNCDALEYFTSYFKSSPNLSRLCFCFIGFYKALQGFYIVKFLKSGGKTDLNTKTRTKAIQNKRMSTSKQLEIVDLIEALIERHREKIQDFKKNVSKTNKEINRLENENQIQFKEISGLYRKIFDNLRVRRSSGNTGVPKRVSSNKNEKIEDKIDKSRINQMIKSFHEEIDWSDRKISLEKIVELTKDNTSEKMFLMTCPECDKAMRITKAKISLTNTIDYSITYYKQHVMWMHHKSIVKKS